MGKDKQISFETDPFKAPVANAVELCATANSVVTVANPRAAANAIIIETAKDGVRYKNGRAMPIAAKRLMAAARTKGIRPSYILSANTVSSGHAQTTWRPTTS